MDIVDQLRSEGEWVEPKRWESNALCEEAAQKIESLRQQLSEANAKVAELERVRDKFYGEANIERQAAQAYKVVLDALVEILGEIPYGDIAGTVEQIIKQRPCGGTGICDHCEPEHGCHAAIEVEKVRTE